MQLTADGVALLCERDAVPAEAELAAMAEVAARHVPLGGHCRSCAGAVGESGWCWIREVAEKRLGSNVGPNRSGRPVAAGRTATSG